MKACHRLRSLHFHIGKKRLESAAFVQMRMISTTRHSHKNHPEVDIPEYASPQGIQGSFGDDCPTFKTWLDSCRRYGLSNCDQQLQGIQSGRKTIAEVMGEQDRLIAEIAEQYRVNMNKQDMQGVQEDVSYVPDINTACPQGVQGEDCERFKLWLENCHRFGFGNCVEQLQGFQRGRKSLSRIFEEQDQAIRDAVSVTMQQRRGYSTSSSSQDKSGNQGKEEVAPEKTDPETPKADDVEEAALSAGQKLKRAVKEYGSTVMVFHISISLMSLGLFYTLVNSGIDVVALLSRIGIGGDSLQAKIAGGTGTFVVAYAVHKLFAPARIAMTLTATPLIVRHLRRIGFIKPPANSSQKS